MVMVGSGAEREVDDIMLTRYACYLVAQNGDPRKLQISFAQLEKGLRNGRWAEKKEIIGQEGKKEVNGFCALLIYY